METSFELSLALMCIVVPVVGLAVIIGGAALLDSPRMSSVNGDWGSAANQLGLGFTPEAVLRPARIIGAVDGQSIECHRGTCKFTYEWMGKDPDDAIWMPERLISEPISGQQVALSLPHTSGKTIIAARGVRLRKPDTLPRFNRQISRFLIWADQASLTSGMIEWLFGDDDMAARLLNFAERDTCVIELSRGQLRLTVENLDGTGIMGPAIELARELAQRIDTVPTIRG